MSDKVPNLFTVGTLSYTKKGIWILFFWLLWNDLAVMLFEQVKTLASFLFKNNGASNVVIALSASLVQILVLLINPVISTWSDRHRGSYGRRRPFLLLATPPLVFFTAALAFMPDLGHYLTQHKIWATFFQHIDVNGPVFCISICFLFFNIFNLALTSLYTYYFWDVVPESVLGHFTALIKIVTIASGFLFNFFLFGLFEHHAKPLLVGLSVFFLIVYLTSVWRVKEGEYPPPEPRRGTGLGVAVRTYFTDCFTQSRYLWLFAAFSFFQVGNLGNMYQSFYALYDLGISMDTIGKFSAIPAIVLFMSGYYFGVLADKFKAARLMGPCVVLLALGNILSYYFIHDKWSFLIWGGFGQLINFAFGTFFSPLVVEIYPREKLGQFCSAASAAQAVCCACIGPLLGLLLDHLHNNRLGFLWSASLDLAAALCFYQVCRIWKQGRYSPDQTGQPSLEESATISA